MKKIVLLLMMFCFEEAVAQLGVIDSQVKVNTYAGADIQSIPMRKPSLLGSTFMVDEWSIGNIVMKAGGTINNMPMKYDILHQELLLLKNKSLLGVKLNFVKSFDFINSSGFYSEFFVNSTWTLDGLSTSGVYQNLTETGNYGLLKVTKIILIKANYYVALDAGGKDDKYEKKAELYILNNTTQDLTKIPRGKKKLFQYFGNENIEKFVKENRIDIKSEHGLIRIIDFANSENPSN